MTMQIKTMIKAIARRVRRLQVTAACLRGVMTSNASGRPPPLSSSAVAKLVKEYFCFQDVDEQSVKQLPSYDDRNFYFRGTTTAELASRGIGSSCPLPGEYVLKLNNPLLASYEVLKGINDLLNHLHAKGFVKCNQPLINREGANLLRITRGKLLEYDSHPEPLEDTAQSIESTFFLRVLTFIPGECFDKVDKHYLTPQLLYDTGHCIGSAEAILKESFRNSYLEKRTLVQWDLNHLLKYRKLLPHHEDSKEKRMAELVLDAFEKHVCPKITNFQKGIIHGDANGLNIIIQKDNVGDYQMVGLIDFGDCISSCYVFDLGILLAYVMTENLDLKNGMSAIEFVGPILRGYTDAFPLSKEEIDCLYHITMARCCQSGLNGTLSFKQEPWNTYLLNSPAKCWRVIELMLSTSKEEVDRMWARALN